MKTYQLRLICVSLILLGLLDSCASRDRAVVSGMPVAYVDADCSHETQAIDTLHNRLPHLKYTDGRLSANDQCPVAKAPLNLRLHALFVNGRPIGFC